MLRNCFNTKDSVQGCALKKEREYSGYLRCCPLKLSTLLIGTTNSSSVTSIFIKHEGTVSQNYDMAWLLIFCLLCGLKKLCNFRHCCPDLGKTYPGAKRDFEIWAFKVFFLWTRKTPLRMASRCTDLNIKIGKNTQKTHHKAWTRF